MSLPAQKNHRFLTNQNARTMCSVGSTIMMIHWHISVHRLFPALLVSSQALSEGIAVPGRETQRSLQARLVLVAL